MKKLFFLLIILFSAIIIYGLITFINENADGKIKESSFSGVITRIYQDTWNHNMYTFLVNSSGQEFECVAEAWPYSRKYASVGDSIFKPKDELYIIIKKKDGSSETFYYK